MTVVTEHRAPMHWPLRQKGGYSSGIVAGGLIATVINSILDRGRESRLTVLCANKYRSRKE